MVQRQVEQTLSGSLEAQVTPQTCILCGRSIPPEARSSRHHLVPRLKGGTHLGTVRLHQICHSAIHARYTEAEIARRLADPAALRDDPELARFGLIRSLGAGRCHAARTRRALSRSSFARP